MEVEKKGKMLTGVGMIAAGEEKFHVIWTISWKAANQ